MKAARWYGRRDIRVEDVAVPEITRPSQVKIAVKYTGICGSDLHEYLGGPIFIPVEKEHPYSGRKAPLTLGHEFAGEIVEVGAGVTNVKVGDRVTVEPILAKDGLKGKYNLDKNLGFVGLAADGHQAGPQGERQQSEHAHLDGEDPAGCPQLVAPPVEGLLHSRRTQARRVSLALLSSRIQGEGARRHGEHEARPGQRPPGQALPSGPELKEQERSHPSSSS